MVCLMSNRMTNASRRNVAGNAMVAIESRRQKLAMASTMAVMVTLINCAVNFYRSLITRLRVRLARSADSDMAGLAVSKAYSIDRATSMNGLAP